MGEAGLSCLGSGHKGRDRAAIGKSRERRLSIAMLCEDSGKSIASEGLNRLVERFFHRTVNTKLEMVDRSCWYRVLSNSVSGPSRILCSRTAKSSGCGGHQWILVGTRVLPGGNDGGSAWDVDLRFRACGQRRI